MSLTMLAISLTYLSALPVVFIVLIIFDMSKWEGVNYAESCMGLVIVVMDVTFVGSKY
jgi:hypothetical protein